MKSLDPQDLIGYTEDEDAKRRFEKRFRLPALTGMILFGSSIIWLVTTKQLNAFILAGIVIGGISLIFVVFSFRFSTPLSISSRPMKRFWVKESQAIGNEIIYVCDDSKTYFRRVFAKRRKNYN